MIGIYYSYASGGPGKVIKNLLMGLDKHSIEYKINTEGDKNIILQSCYRLSLDLSNCIIGPNICVLPYENRYMTDGLYVANIVPSLWVKNLYSKYMSNEKIQVWAVGIDTDMFYDTINIEKEFDFLIYHKRRSYDDLNFITNELEKRSKSFYVITYGGYNENEFIDKISKARRGIVIDSSESQGIAIQEMMSCNLPLLVWDVKEWRDYGEAHKCNSTCVPYFDLTCGEIFYNTEEFDNIFDKFSSSVYSPREYIINNLSVERKAKDLINIFG